MPRQSLIEQEKCYIMILKSEGIDEQRIGLVISKEIDICHFYFFKNKLSLSDFCWQWMSQSIILTDIKIIIVKGVHYRVVTNRTYNECYRLFESYSSTDKLGSL